LSRFPNPICLALDAAHRDEVMRLVEATADHVGVFKVGLTAFSGCGPDIVGEVASARPVFLDLKLHDIPAQVEGAIAAVRGLGAAYTTVHASGGPDMIKAAVAAAGDDLAVLGVTVLTSLDDVHLARLGFVGDLGEQVVRLGELALAAGVGGLVSSPREVALLRSLFGPEPLLVVPGIRPSDSEGHDQRRTETPSAALRDGADLLVVGRPVTAAVDPAAAARRLLEELGA
jgi:orotidine-5'-phosphate decarboxylase